MGAPGDDHRPSTSGTVGMLYDAEHEGETGKDFQTFKGSVIAQAFSLNIGPQFKEDLEGKVCMDKWDEVDQLACDQWVADGKHENDFWPTYTTEVRSAYAKLYGTVFKSLTGKARAKAQDIQEEPGADACVVWLMLQIKEKANPQTAGARRMLIKEYFNSKQGEDETVEEHIDKLKNFWNFKLGAKVTAEELRYH
ncbi:unnamed protein product, partial [Amoebophrya sp. A120]|eukprot:GSA120T00016559001.1